MDVEGIKTEFIEVFEESDNETAEELLAACYSDKERVGTNYMENRFNLSQLGMMVDFMTLNPNLIRGTITPKFCKSDRKKKWEELAGLLNSDGLGVKKTPYKWNKCWNDLKTSLKHKANRIKRQKAVPNEKKYGNYCYDLTELETKVLKMIGHFEDSGSSNDESQSVTFNIVSENSTSSIASDDQGTHERVRKNVLLHRSDPSSDDDEDDDEADFTAIDTNETNYTFLNSQQGTSGLPPHKKVKILHHPYFKAKKEADLVTQLKKQNEILDRIAESVERIEKSLEKFSESSHVLYQKSGLLENIAVNMERLAETFVIASMSLKKLSEK